MSIEIIQTEQNFEDLLTPLTDIPFKIRRYPGTMEEFGKPWNCLQVVITFKNLKYEQPDAIFNKRCVTQMNEAYWDLRIYSINVRDYHNIAQLGTNIVKAIRGQTVLVPCDPKAGRSPLMVTDFGFKKAEKGFCYQFDISTVSHFTENYVNVR